MSDDSTDYDDVMDQWANTIGDDDELDTLWDALIDATGPASATDMEARVAQHLATHGARSRRTTEGLILAAMAATAEEGPGWEDWRVILHRHFARDERMDVGVAAAILLEWRKTETPPDWHSAPEGVMDRVIRSYVRDILVEVQAMQNPDQAQAASAALVALASELFDFSISLQTEQLEELQNSAEVAALLADLQRQLADSAEGYEKPIANNLVKGHALVEVALRQLEISASVVH